MRGVNHVLAVGIAAVLAAPLVFLAVANANPDLDPLIMAAGFHFWIVGGTALAAAGACALLVVAGRALRETRLLFLAIAFMTIAGVFSVHGLMTPGYIADSFYQSVAVSAWISAVAGAVFVAIGVIDMPQSVQRFIQRAGGMIFAWAAICVGVFVALSMETEHWLDNVPTDNQTIQYILAAGATALFLIAALRYAQAYFFARLPSQAAIVLSLLLLAEVPPILLWGTAWRVSWWSYHALYAAAFVVLFAGWGIEARRAGSLRAISDALSMRDALAQLNRGREAHILELVDAIEAKDVATLGHVSRVASYAMAIGKALHLKPGELRSLVLAAEMHDVGKIGVPDGILRKPARLTDEEFAIVRQHAARGHEIAERVDALRDVASVIRAHHERLDGSGYPDGLQGEQIPLLARIIAVADTYDAMTSARPYRETLSHDAALAELRRVAGRELDARCVDALVGWFGAEQRIAA